MTQLWDAYDINMNKLEGITLVRGNRIEEGIFHLVCEIAVKHKDGQYLLMQRDWEKHYGGMGELTAGGSALIGETPIECAIRELKEETGISCDCLEEIGRVIDKEHRSIYIEYMCCTECDHSSILLQEGETVDYKWVDKSELKNNNTLATKRMQLFIKEIQ